MACRTTNAPLYVGGAGSRGAKAVAPIASDTDRRQCGHRIGASIVGSASPRTCRSEQENARTNS